MTTTALTPTLDEAQTIEYPYGCLHVALTQKANDEPTLSAHNSHGEALEHLRTVFDIDADAPAESVLVTLAGLGVRASIVPVAAPAPF